ncbi:TPA: hypothetical protein ACF27G_001536 [Klebsiella pneumoniae]|uniref:hypothetical protein n=1 Tax=Klebsiella TaxID=570 RepID=UPI0012EA6DA6|nr:hypothetical protein [Klebsiella pneumoniae]MBK2412547.1 hypothetical protein [Klebsiella pneumoniae]MBK3252477.1 hypothetical protein [Klebsiella pneumoniae]MBK3289680.1 hypothetical protein [Klebsiella pneumoniae]MBL2048414.1 hypothetical protein [Klebsiella pneumoniae]HBW2295857.1 hypothetical protein [Klebsiella pneumoniae]
MTSKLTREERMQALYDMKVGQVLSLADIENVKMLARMALAAMDSETHDAISFDEWSRKCALQITLCYPDFREKAQYIWDSARETQQPAPVVPEEATPDSIEILASARRRDHAVFQWDEDQRNAAADSWNACRAAMLQELKKSAGTEAICRSDENVQVLNTIKATPALGSLPKTDEVQNTNSPVIPDGYVMVPVEPNGDMLAAAQDAYGETDGDIASTLRAAMLAAAQQEGK